MAEGHRAKTASAPVVAILANDHAFHERIPELLAFKPEVREVFAADDQSAKTRPTTTAPCKPRTSSSPSGRSASLLGRCSDSMPARSTPSSSPAPPGTRSWSSTSDTRAPTLGRGGYRGSSTTMSSATCKAPSRSGPSEGHVGARPSVRRPGRGSASRTPPRQLNRHRFQTSTGADQPQLRSLFDQAAGVSSQPNNIWVGDQGARPAVVQLTRDIGMEPFNGDSLEHAAT